MCGPNVDPNCGRKKLNWSKCIMSVSLIYYFDDVSFWYSSPVFFFFFPAFVFSVLVLLPYFSPR